MRKIYGVKLNSTNRKQQQHLNDIEKLIAIKIRLGRYSYGGEQDSHPYFKQLDVGTPNYLYYLEWLGVW